MLMLLATEMHASHERIVLVEWGSRTPLHGMGRTAYGYVMNCLALVDLLSQYRTGSTKGQTDRMVAFLVDYFGYEERVSRVVVTLWRHTLMHTGKPRELLGTSGTRYRYLLQWGPEHLPRDQHMRFQASAQSRILNIGVLFLAEDLQEAADKYFDEVDASPHLQRRLLDAEDELTQPHGFRD
jgi:hypothetical protein